MKKLFSILILLTTVIMTSCTNHEYSDPHDAMVHYYLPLKIKSGYFESEEEYDCSVIYVMLQDYESNNNTKYTIKDFSDLNIKSVVFNYYYPNISLIYRGRILVLTLEEESANRDGYIKAMNILAKYEFIYDADYNPDHLGQTPPFEDINL